MACECDQVRANGSETMELNGVFERFSLQTPDGLSVYRNGYNQYLYFWLLIMTGSSDRTTPPQLHCCEAAQGTMHLAPRLPLTGASQLVLSDQCGWSPINRCSVAVAIAHVMA